MPIEATRPPQAHNEAAADPDVLRQESSQYPTEKDFVCTAYFPRMANEMIQRPKLRVQFVGVMLRNVLHGLDAIYHEIDDDLLHLDPIGTHGQRAWRQF